MPRSVKVTCEHVEVIYIYIIATFGDVGQGILKKWPFSSINCSGGFPYLFLEVSTGINSFFKVLIGVF